MFSIKTVKIDKTNEEAILNRAIAKKRLKRNCNKYIYYINILVTCSGNLVSYSIVKKWKLFGNGFLNDSFQQ